MDHFNILAYGYIYLDNHLTIMINCNDEIKDNQIYISQYLYLQLKDPLNAHFAKAQHAPYQYDDKDFRYNPFPNIPICKEVTLSIVRLFNEVPRQTMRIQDQLPPSFQRLCFMFQLWSKKNKQQRAHYRMVNCFKDYSIALSQYRLQNCDISSKCRSKITNCCQLNNLLRDQYVYIHIEKVQADKQTDWYILDFKVANIKFQEEYSYSHITKSTLDLKFQDIIYQLGEYEHFRKQINNIIRLQKSISIGVESRKNLGKRLLLKQIANQNGILYFEKDFGMISSLRFTEKLVLKIQDSPCILLLRNFSKIEQVLLLNKQHVSKDDISNEIIKIIKKIKKLKNVILILCNEDFSNYPIVKSFVDFYIRFYPQTNVSQQLIEFYQLEQSEDEISQLLRETTWRVLEKEIIQSKQNFVKELESKLKTQTISSKTKMDDVGGMEGAIKEVAKTIILPQMYPELFDELVKPRRGILFFGPPGTGKTLLAKCIACEMKMNFISVKGPEMLNQYIGQSESNIRDLFKRAKDNAPSLVFFDELDALAPARGNQSDSNQVMDRIVAQLLTEIDNLLDGIFIIGATNRPDLLDPALLRPGRFDKLMYLGIKTDKESRVKILRALTKSDKFDEIIDEIPNNMTGADFYGLVSQATIYATKRTIQSGLNEMELAVEDLREALKSIRPSVSEQDLQKYEELKKKYQ
ncbi:unnamed protein product (macronuclear) [Paramecium tetraurelia]|uniref:Peroxisomal ATPase PEX6 n=1 Tax=Paramecium tetraurelia TaxID=5888 RepID=A0CHU5_PARTE|nr:uncharacterized protein GSPATT00038464001 [Paramecium tetraurelia]CAK70362.1 unnamed protein product [Paramecium tetraurelia]|eukprot:XP_001437759.1 hypothetical protein (macronuclear) [Paramecium tetraurelia strain d4-2]